MVASAYDATCALLKIRRPTKDLKHDHMVGSRFVKDVPNDW